MNPDNIGRLAAIGGLIAGLGFALPSSVTAQTATPVNDQIKQLQNEIRNIQKQYQTQIHSLQKQLDDLKAVQTAPRPAPAPPPAPGLAVPPPGALPPPVPEDQVLRRLQPRPQPDAEEFSAPASM